MAFPSPTPPFSTDTPGWPHVPPHWLFAPGIYMVTAGTMHKTSLLDSPERLDLVQGSLFRIAAEFGWGLEAWAVLRNHYHFIARSPETGAQSLRRVVSKLHMLTAKELNRQDDTPGRRVWFQFYETELTFERSYLARLNYVDQNPAHHGVVSHAASYPWCSAAWFEAKASPAFVKTVRGFKTDRLRVADDF